MVFYYHSHLTELTQDTSPELSVRSPGGLNPETFLPFTSINFLPNLKHCILSPPASESLACRVVVSEQDPATKPVSTDG